MSSMNLYRLTAETQALYDRMIDSIDCETGEVDIDTATELEVKKEEFAGVAINYATVIRMLKARKEEAEAEIDRLTAIKKRLESITDRMAETLSTACQQLDIMKIHGLTADISFRKSEQVKVDNLELLPKEYVREKVTYTADKTAIKNAIKAGEDIPGAYIETVQNIQIK